MSVKSIENVTSGIQKKLDAMIKRANSAPQFFKRNVKPKYITAQKRRFMTENNSEYTQGGWLPLQNEAYKKRKPIQFKNYPGSGTKLMVATNRLVNSIIGLSDDYREVTGDRTWIVSTVVPYAPFASEKRPVDTFTPKFYNEIGRDLLDYIRGKS